MNIEKNKIWRQNYKKLIIVLLALTTLSSTLFIFKLHRQMNASENMGIEYRINKDGTYSCQGGTYKYKLTLTGKHNGATKEGKITVLTNNKDLQYEDVFNSLISSQLEVGEPKFVILGME